MQLSSHKQVTEFRNKMHDKDHISKPSWSMFNTYIKYLNCRKEYTKHVGVQVL